MHAMAAAARDVLNWFEKWLGTDVDWSSIPRVPTWLAILAPVAFAYYQYSTWTFNTFKKLGIKGPRPWPMFGTSWAMMTKGIFVHDMEMRKYGKVVGTFQGRTPMMIIYDPDILKQILVKEFSNFTNRFDPGLTEYPVGKLLTILKDDHWKHVRNVITPTFSSGKLRKMNAQLHKCAETLVTNLTAKADSRETFDLNQICSAYTMDVIASTAFGIEIDSHNDPNNQFVKMGQKAFMFSATSPKIIIFIFFPFLMKPLTKIGFTFFPKDLTKFFVDVINKSLDERKQGSDGKQKVDFIQLMANAHMDEDEEMEESKKVEQPQDRTSSSTTEKSESWNKKVGLTHEEVLAQGFLFFLAGFATTANTLSQLGYSLATNPDCQERLLREIDDVMKDHDQVDYDVVNKMPYLDMCLSETLRLYPAGVRTDRVCRNDITINGVFIPKGMTVVSPIYVMHMDPEVWPEPTKFNPERFTAEAKEARNPYYYMPFGVGPRNCVGMRLALTELKMATASILQTLKFVVCPETEVPLVLDKLAMKAVNGIKIQMERRKK